MSKKLNLIITSVTLVIGAILGMLQITPPRISTSSPYYQAFSHMMESVDIMVWCISSADFLKTLDNSQTGKGKAKQRSALVFLVRQVRLASQRSML